MKKIIPVLTAVVCLALKAGAAVLPAEKLLPEDTMLVFSIPDFTKAKEIYNTSPQAQLLSDPSMQAFKDKFVSKFKSEYVTPLERDLGIHFEDYTGLLQGQFTFAVIQNGWDGKSKDSPEPATLLLLDTKDKSAQLKTTLADLKKKWVDSGKSVKTEKIRDIEFSVAMLSSNDLPKTLKSLKSADADTTAEPESNEGDSKKPEKKEPIYIGQAESLLIMGDSPKAIEKVLASMAGSGVKTLSELPAYDANHNSMFRNAPVYGWINSKTIIDALVGSMSSKEDSSAPAAGGFDFKPEKIFAAIGLTGLKTVAFNYLYVNNEGAQFNLQLGVPESSRTGIFKILAGEAKETTPPPFVPADAVKFQRWRIDGQNAWASIQKIVNDINPQGMNSINFLISMAEAGAKEKDPSFDIKKNLFGNLGNDLVSYEKSPKGQTLADLNNAPSLFLIGSPNAEQLAGALKTTFGAFMSQGGSAPTEREFLGRKIYTLTMPSVGEKDAKPRNLNFAASGGYVAISTDNALLEEYMRSNEKEGKALRDTAGLSDAIQKVSGSGTTLFGYSNDSEAMRVAIDAFKKDFTSATASSTLAPLAAATGTDVEKLKEWFDPSLLPTFDKISKYFYFNVYSGSANSEGLNFKLFAPVPPQLKK